MDEFWIFMGQYVVLVCRLTCDGVNVIISLNQACWVSASASQELLPNVSLVCCCLAPEQYVRIYCKSKKKSFLTRTCSVDLHASIRWYFNQ